MATPIDAREQTLLRFGLRSHWLQPWRAYFDTAPATLLLNAAGLNFNVSADEAPATARLLAAQGFRRARVEVGWSALSYDDPTHLSNPADLATKLRALRDNGIRPLILLNAHHGVPCPTHFFEATLVEPARAGDRSVRVDAATAAQIVPGKTGLNALDGSYKAADVLFTSVHPDGTVDLSKPIDRDLAAGPHRAATLRYAPFQPPSLASGAPNPRFEETLAGWLSYVDTVTRAARETLGSDDFDVEVWNELSFGSDFLRAWTYYDPAPAGVGDVAATILARTVAWLRDPAHGVSGVGIGNGFANQRPWDAGSTSPPGLTAIDKHPYQGMHHFPEDAAYSGVQPVDARGQLSEWRDAQGHWHDDFVPTYDSFFPEYFLSGIQTETMVRDLSPLIDSVYGTLHGRLTHPDGAAAPSVWITELNMNAAHADPRDPANPSGPPLAHLTSADVEHLQAKSTLRSLVAYVNKGVSAIDFYAAKGSGLGLIDQRFFDALSRDPSTYPGDALGGTTPEAVRRLMDAFAGATALPTPRRLTLQELSTPDAGRQFAGDGTSAHPPLLNRDVTAVLPFQVDANRFAIPAYVMTRNVAHLYRPEAPESDTSRYDLPPERYTLRIGGLHGTSATVSALDPLTGASVPVTVLSRGADDLRIQMPLTDSPRVLMVDDG